MSNRTSVNPAQEALDVLNEFHMDVSAPVPVEKIAKELGAIVRFSPLDEALSGMIFIKDGVPIIGVNALHHPNRQRFTIAHECGHLRLHRNLLSSEVHVDKEFPVLMRDMQSALGENDIEIQANRFAAELLIPQNLLEQALSDTPVDIDASQTDAMAKKFRVSKQAFEYRLKYYYLKK